MLRKNGKKWLLRTLLPLACLAILFSGCIPQLGFDFQSTQPSDIPTSVPLPLAEVVFRVQTPVGSQPSVGVFLDVLDEVTGLAFNPIRYPMEASGAGAYSVHVPVPVGSMVKYRYLRDGSPLSQETNGSGAQVRYRMLLVSGPVEIQDQVAGWADQQYQGETGRIIGRVTDAATGDGLPGILVMAAGSQTMTAADGSYQLQNIPPGTQMVTACALDGAFSPFQQGAVVAPGTATPAPVQLRRAALVKVTFNAHLQGTQPAIASIRLVGNILALGNTFSDLRGGMNVVATRAPVLERISEKEYRLELNLPAGLDLRYKYSLGDGFWNAEHSPQGAFLTRQLIVPDHDIVVEDYVLPWQTDQSAPITFNVNVPAATMPDNVVSIQLNPYAWTEPIPMWPSGNGRWSFVLYSPLQLLGNVGYRYCRNDQCGIADDQATMGPQAHGYPFSAGKLAQDFEDEVNGWAWWQRPSQPTTVISTSINPRSESFVAGFELAANYNPSWAPYWGPALDSVRKSGANAVLITPTWRYTRQNPPSIELVPGQDLLWQDIQDIGQGLQSRQINSILFPQMIPVTRDWWTSAVQDAAWWNSWFDQYAQFAFHHASLAKSMNARALVLGGPWVDPALPGGTLPDGSPSAVPDISAQQWRLILSGVRERYQGPVLWAMTHSNNLTSGPTFLLEFDGIYILWATPVNLSTPDGPAVEFGRLLDSEIKPLSDRSGKPVWLGLAFASFPGASGSCVQMDQSCQGYHILLPGSPTLPAEVNLQEQVDLYNAALLAVNQRAWIQGVVSRGFYPAVELQDGSSSVFGKPAWDVLWYWYSKLLGKSS